MTLDAVSVRPVATERERVVNALRDDILDGRLGPGVTLRAREGIERFGTSNTPLREAFFQLAAEGLLEATPQRGFVVSRLTRSGANDVISVTSFLWDLMIRRVVPSLDSATIVALNRCHEDFDEALSVGDRRATVRSGEAFSRLLLDMCTSPELLRTMDSTRPQVVRLTRLLASDDTLRGRGVVQHEILAAAGSTDVERPLAALEDYWDAMRRDVEASDRLNP